MSSLQPVYIEVAQESLPGAGDFDCNVLGLAGAYPSPLDAATHYSYGDPTLTSFNGPTPALEADRSHLFLVDGIDGVSLFIVHDRPDNPDGGKAEVRVDVAGYPDGVTRTVADDLTSEDSYTGVASGYVFTPKHLWNLCCTDGEVLTALDGSWSAIVSFTDVDANPSTPTIEGMTEWYAYSGDDREIALALQPDRRVRLRPVGAAPSTQLVWSTDPGSAFVVQGDIPGQLQAINNPPPAFDPDTWTSLDASRRHEDLHEAAVCTCADPQSVNAGTADQFALPTEGAVPSAALASALPREEIDFDLIPGENAPTESPCAHTFAGLPRRITAAAVQLRVRAGSASITGNDKVRMGFTTDPSTLDIRWNRVIGTSGEQVGLFLYPWDYGSEEDLTLDLAALPLVDGTTLDLLADLNGNGFLDVTVSDETGVDYMTLTITVDALTQPFVNAVDAIASTEYWLTGADEVTFDNCSSAWYRWTFDMPVYFRNASLYGAVNADDLGVAYLNGHRLSAALTIDDVNAVLAGTPPDRTDGEGHRLLSRPTTDPVGTPCGAPGHAMFSPGLNELVFGVMLVDASPTGLEFTASVSYDLVGDCDADGVLDVDDCAAFAGCMSGPSVVAGSGCTCADFDDDQDVDLLSMVREFATDFQPPQQASVPGTPAAVSDDDIPFDPDPEPPRPCGTGLYRGEQDMFVFLIDPMDWTEINGEAFAPGRTLPPWSRPVLWNSEVGKRSVGIQTFWFQAVCQNHIVWDAVEVVEFSRKHTANVHEAFSEIRGIVERLVAKRDERRDGFARVIRKARDPDRRQRRRGAQDSRRKGHYARHRQGRHWRLPSGMGASPCSRWSMR